MKEMYLYAVTCLALSVVIVGAVVFSSGFILGVKQNGCQDMLEKLQHLRQDETVTWVIGENENQYNITRYR